MKIAFTIERRLVLRSKEQRPMLLMAGGTGGHVMPALAVAEELRAQGYQVHWLGTRLGIEARLVPFHQIPIDYIQIKGLRGKGALGWLLAPWRVAKAFFQARKILKRIRPMAVISMGGYLTGPGGLAAWSLKIPLLIHEQNAISGLTNRLLAPFATKILTAFPNAFHRPNVVLTGNPIRTQILKVHSQKVIEKRASLRVLVVGGSLGAQSLNLMVPKALGLMEHQDKIEVWHQTGSKGLDDTQLAYRDTQVKCKQTPFIDDMAQAYVWADLVICRSGALTVSELAAAAVPSILVPFPHAVDDHQSFNARYLAEAGAAILLPQSELTPQKLCEILTSLVNNRERLQIMSKQCQTLAKPNATQEVANFFIEVSRGSSSPV